jgi:hypothetical protein
VRQHADGTGKARGGAFPLLVLLATVALAAAGAAVGLFAERRFAAGLDPSWPTVALFLILLTAAGFPTLQFQYRDQVDALDLFEAILTPAVLVLPPLQAVAVVGVVIAVTEGIQRIHPVKASFNVAQWMAATAAGSLVLAALRDRAAPPTTRDLVALAAGMTVIMAVNDLALIGVLR